MISELTTTNHSEKNILHHHKLLQLLHYLINSSSEPSTDGRVPNITVHLDTGLVTLSNMSWKTKNTQGNAFLVICVLKETEVRYQVSDIKLPP